MSDRIGVMDAGTLVELGSAEQVFKRPLHPYTYGLMHAFPSIIGLKTELTTLPGEPPDLLHPGIRDLDRLLRQLDAILPRRRRVAADRGQPKPHGTRPKIYAELGARNPPNQ